MGDPIQPLIVLALFSTSDVGLYSSSTSSSRDSHKQHVWSASTQLKQMKQSNQLKSFSISSQSLRVLVYCISSISGVLVRYLHLVFSGRQPLAANRSGPPSSGALLNYSVSIGQQALASVKARQGSAKLLAAGLPAGPGPQRRPAIHRHTNMPSPRPSGGMWAGLLHTLPAPLSPTPLASLIAALLCAWLARPVHSLSCSVFHLLFACARLSLVSHATIKKRKITSTASSAIPSVSHRGWDRLFRTIANLVLPLLLLVQSRKEALGVQLAACSWTICFFFFLFYLQFLFIRAPP